MNYEDQWADALAEAEEQRLFEDEVNDDWYVDDEED